MHTCMHPRHAPALRWLRYAPSMPDIVLNGEQKALAANTTVLDLLSQHGLSSQQVAVELNRVIVPRDRHGATVLSQGDQLEIVTFVGGG